MITIGNSWVFKSGDEYGHGMWFYGRELVLCGWELHSHQCQNKTKPEVCQMRVKCVNCVAHSDLDSQAIFCLTILRKMSMIFTFILKSSLFPDWSGRNNFSLRKEGGCMYPHSHLYENRSQAPLWIPTYRTSSSAPNSLVCDQISDLQWSKQSTES